MYLAVVQVPWWRMVSESIWILFWSKAWFPLKQWLKKKNKQTNKHFLLKGFQAMVIIEWGQEPKQKPKKRNPVWALKISRKH